MRKRQMQTKWGVVELFAGVGGMAQGFAEQGSFDIIALTDIDADARDTYLENFPDFSKGSYILKDIRNLTANELRDIAAGRQIDGLIGCPPCQGFSAAGKRDPNDARNFLTSDYIRLICEFHPKFFALENVPGILRDAKFQAWLANLESELKYKIWSGVLNAALYGLPQTRQRAVVIGVDSELSVTPSPPPPTHCGRRKVYDYSSQKLVSPRKSNGWRALGVYPELRLIGGQTANWLAQLNGDFAKLKPLVTVEDAISYLQPLESGEQCQQDGVYNHEAWNHSSDLIERLSKIPEGGNAEGAGRCRRRDRRF